jgi:hypothetical protein
MTTPKEALERARAYVEAAPGSNAENTLRMIDEALASFKGDAVERVARYLSSLDAFHLYYRGMAERTDAAKFHARAILATGLVPDEAAVRADAIDPADLWDRYCDETDEKFRTPQGAMAFAVAAIRSGGGE